MVHPAPARERATLAAGPFSDTPALTNCGGELPVEATSAQAAIQRIRTLIPHGHVRLAD